MVVVEGGWSDTQWDHDMSLSRREIEWVRVWRRVGWDNKFETELSKMTVLGGWSVPEVQKDEHRVWDLWIVTEEDDCCESESCTSTPPP